MPRKTGAAANVLNAFSPDVLMPAVQAGTISGQDYLRMVNIGSLLRSLHAKGGFTKGPEAFQDPQILAQQAQRLMALGREHPLITQSLDLTGKLKAAQAARKPKPRAVAEPMSPRSPYDFQSPGDILRQLYSGEEPWLVQARQR